MSHQQPTDALEDPGITHTEADETSETRFGPRPVPEGHRRHSGPYGSRRIPPHGDVSPDGSRAYPRPSRFAKWVVWGGTGVVAAALTAGTVYAARGVADLIAGHDDDRPRPPQPPRPTPPSEVRPTPMQCSAPASAPAPRPRGPRRGLMEEIEANTATLTSSIDNVMKSVTAAVAGFRTVAGQANTIVREFGDAADLVRDILDRRPSDRPQREYHTTHEDASGPADHDPRSHRL